ncbi:MAG: hypothetical protein AAF434_13225 [Pseudomonadota bacterium]
MYGGMPENYEEWKDCITVHCGIPLTSDYIKKRLVALRDPKEHGTKRFTELYGDLHLKRVIEWFEQAGAESG